MNLDRAIEAAIEALDAEDERFYYVVLGHSTLNIEKIARIAVEAAAPYLLSTSQPVDTADWKQRAEQAEERIDTWRETCIQMKERTERAEDGWRKAAVLWAEEERLADRLAEALRFHEERRINPTSIGGPALAAWEEARR